MDHRWDWGKKNRETKFFFLMCQDKANRKPATFISELKKINQSKFLLQFFCVFFIIY